MFLGSMVDLILCHDNWSENLFQKKNTHEKRKGFTHVLNCNILYTTNWHATTATTKQHQKQLLISAITPALNFEASSAELRWISTRNSTIGGASWTRPCKGIAMISPFCTLCCRWTMWPLIKVPARLIFTKVTTLSFWVTSKCCLEIALRKFSSGTKEHQNSGGCMDLPTRILPIGPGHSLWLPLDPKEDKQTWCLLNSTTSLAGGGAGSAWLKDIFSCSAGLRPYSHSIYPALMMSPSSSVASDSTWLPFRRIPFELRFFTMLLDPLKRTSRSGGFQDTPKPNVMMIQHDIPI